MKGQSFQFKLFKANLTFAYSSLLIEVPTSVFGLIFKSSSLPLPSFLSINFKQLQLASITSTGFNNFNWLQ